MSFKAVLFDAYGTLLDVDAAASKLARSGQYQGLEHYWPELSALWRTKQLSYSWLRSVSNTVVPFWQITCDALDYALDALDLNDEALRTSLLELYRRLDAYPEVSEVLTELNRRGMPAAVLSNGNHHMLDEAFGAAGLTNQLDPMLSAEDAGIFKPSAHVYQLACDAYNAHPGELLFVSANGWDAVNASQFGFVTVWINRASQPHERLGTPPAMTGSTLHTVLDMLNNVNT